MGISRSAAAWGIAALMAVALVVLLQGVTNSSSSTVLLESPSSSTTPEDSFLGNIDKFENGVALARLGQEDQLAVLDVAAAAPAAAAAAASAPAAAPAAAAPAIALPPPASPAAPAAAAANPAPAAPAAPAISSAPASASGAAATATGGVAAAASASAAGAAASASAASSTTTQLKSPLFIMSHVLADEEKMDRAISAEIGTDGSDEANGEVERQFQASRRHRTRRHQRRDDLVSEIYSSDDGNGQGAAGAGAARNNNGDGDNTNSNTNSNNVDGDGGVDRYLTRNNQVQSAAAAAAQPALSGVSSSASVAAASASESASSSTDATNQPSDVEKLIERDESKSFLASQRPAVGDNDNPESTLGNHANTVLRKDVEQIEKATEEVPNEHWQQRLCTREEGAVALHVKHLAKEQEQLGHAYEYLKEAKDNRDRLEAILARTEDEHKTSEEEVLRAVRDAREWREEYLGAIAKTNAAKVAVVRERAGDVSVSGPVAEREMALAAAAEVKARNSYRMAVHARLFSEEAERRAASRVSESRTGMDRAVQILQRADAARLDAIAEVDAADVELQRARLRLFACYTKLREAADTVAAIRGESLAKAAMSGVSNAAHIHGGGD